MVAEYPGLAEVSLSEILEATQAQDEPEPEKASKRKSSGLKAVPSPPVVEEPSAQPEPPIISTVMKRDVRSEVGQRAFDDEVLRALSDLGGYKISSSDLRAQLRADPLQLRASLTRLVESKQVKVSGKKRGTRYSLIE